ncbi:MAG: hypothetical protein Q9217_005293, partial [Psora testacea]
MPIKLVGRWPDAHFLHGAIYLGSELITANDTVLIKPSTSEPVQSPPKILLVTSIVLSLKGLHPDPPHYTHITGDT